MKYHEDVHVIWGDRLDGWARSIRPPSTRTTDTNEHSACISHEERKYKRPSWLDPDHEPCLSIFAVVGRNGLLFLLDDLP
jgi:hypothetical protein